MCELLDAIMTSLSVLKAMCVLLLAAINFTKYKLNTNSSHFAYSLTTTRSSYLLHFITVQHRSPHYPHLRHL